jgi:outer membrane protein
MKIQAKKILSYNPDKTKSNNLKSLSNTSSWFNHLDIIKKLFLFFIILIMPQKINASEFSLFIANLVDNNPEIKSSYYTYRSYSEGRMSSIGTYLPQAELNYNYQVQDIDKVTSDTIDNYETNEYNINVTQKLLAPELIPSISKTKLVIQEALLNYKKIKSEVILDLINTIVTIQSLEEQVLFENNNKTLNENLYQAAKIKNKSGIISQIDLLQSKTEYLKAKTDYINISKALSIAKAHYESLSGSNIMVNFDLEEFITHTDFDLKDITQSAYKNNYDAMILLNQLSQAKQNKKIEQADYLPRADLYYNYKKVRGSYSYYTNNDDTNAFTSYGVKVTVPLFSSFKTTAKVSSSQNFILSKEQDFFNLTNQVKEDTTRLWEELNVNKALIKEHSSYTEYAEKSYNAIKKQYDARLKDITYLLDAQNTLLDARSKLNHTNAEMMKNYFEIIFITGKLDEKTFLDSAHN